VAARFYAYPLLPIEAVGRARFGRLLRRGRVIGATLEPHKGAAPRRWQLRKGRLRRWLASGDTGVLE